MSDPDNPNPPGDPTGAVVIELRPKPAGSVTLRASYAERKKPLCAHRDILVDEQARTIECAGCGVILDPIGVMSEYARGERTFLWVQHEVELCRKRLFELEQEEKKLRAKVSALKRKVAASQ